MIVLNCNRRSIHSSGGWGWMHFVCNVEEYFLQAREKGESFIGQASSGRGYFYVLDIVGIFDLDMPFVL